VGIEETPLFGQLGVLEESISIFISGTASSAEGACLKFSLVVSSSIRTLVLTCVNFGWYFLPIDAVVDLRYPFGFNNLSGSDTCVVC
jgi:hypothetical protein